MIRSIFRSAVPVVRCSCGASLPLHTAPKFLTTSATTLNDTISTSERLILTARKVISAKHEEGDAVKEAKRLKHLEQLKSALRDVEEGEELVVTLTELAKSEPDEDLKNMALTDLPEAEDTLASMRKHLQVALVPPSPLTNLSAIMEINSGVGGTEAAIFAADLARMYTRFAARKGWRAKIVDVTNLSSAGSVDAYKDVTIEITGEGAYGTLRNEAGVHRVQRVPATETQGRLQTSTAAVVVLPVEVNDVEDDLFDVKDVKLETMRSRGAGGQHVNKTESAIRLTHLPTGITVSMQDSRSQQENRSLAWKVLRARLLDKRLQDDELARRSARLNQVSGTSRSDKIRTYNFSQDRLTDHRIGFHSSGLANAMGGGEILDDVMLALQDREQEESLQTLLDDMK